jgi:hypothetical protein
MQPKSAKKSIKNGNEVIPVKLNRYASIIEHIFLKHYKAGMTEFEFERTEIQSTATELKIKLPSNLGDLIYSFRYRTDFPQSIQETIADGMEWSIQGAGRAKYQFKQVKLNRIVPREELVTIKVPDSTPEIISAYALGDEQALLAIVRYNRLIDIFLGITAYSLQNHLRTAIKGIGQIEIDEIYVGIDKNGRQFAIPVQAKGGNDKHGIVQTQQDIAFCKKKYSSLICRPVSAQFMSDGTIAMFALTVEDDEIKVVDEKHYQLVPAKGISASDLESYDIRAI